MMINSRLLEVRPNTPDSFYKPDSDVWRSGIVGIGSIAIVTVALAILNLFATDTPSFITSIVSLIVAVLPSLLFFVDMQIRKRRNEGEIASLLVILFIMGALLAAAVTNPILYDLIGLKRWLGVTNSQSRFLSNVLIAGAWHTFMIFAVIRFAIWNSHLFIRRTDGILFALTITFGYSAALNVLHMLDTGLSILNGNLRLLSEQCSLLVIAIIIGYFLGKNRFERTRFYFLPLGAIVATVLGGLLLFACVELNSTALAVDSSGYSPWPGIVVGFLALIGAFAAVTGLLNYENAIARNRVEAGSGQ